MGDQSTGGGLQFGRKDDLGEVVATLSEGDRVVIEDRTYPMEVFETDSECIGSNIHPTTVAYLDFRGRVYRLRGNTDLPDGDTTPPRLELRKEGEWETKLSSVTTITIDSDQKIISDTRAGDWLAEAGIDVR